MAIETTEDKEKLTGLYVRYANLLYHVSFDIIKDTYMSEDIAMEAMLKAAEQIENIREVESLETKCYLLTIVRRKSIDYLRRGDHARMTFVDEVPFSERIYGDPVEQLVREESYWEVRNFVESYLRETDTCHKDVLIMHFLRDMKNSEIAEITGLSNHNVAVIINRARNALKKRLRNQAGKAAPFYRSKKGIS